MFLLTFLRRLEEQINQLQRRRHTDTILPIASDTHNPNKLNELMHSTRIGSVEVTTKFTRVYHVENFLRFIHQSSASVFWQKYCIQFFWRTGNTGLHLQYFWLVWRNDYLSLLYSLSVLVFQRQYHYQPGMAIMMQDTMGKSVTMDVNGFIYMFYRNIPSVCILCCFAELFSCICTRCDLRCGYKYLVCDRQVIIALLLF